MRLITLIFLPARLSSALTVNLVDHSHNDLDGDQSPLYTVVGRTYHP